MPRATLYLMASPQTNNWHPCTSIAAQLDNAKPTLRIYPDGVAWHAAFAELISYAEAQRSSAGKERREALEVELVTSDNALVDAFALGQFDAWAVNGFRCRKPPLRKLCLKLERVLADVSLRIFAHAPRSPEEEATIKRLKALAKANLDRRHDDPGEPDEDDA